MEMSLRRGVGGSRKPQNTPYEIYKSFLTKLLSIVTCQNSNSIGKWFFITVRFNEIFLSFGSKWIELWKPVKYLWGNYIITGDLQFKYCVAPPSARSWNKFAVHCIHVLYLLYFGNLKYRWENINLKEKSLFSFHVKNLTNHKIWKKSWQTTFNTTSKFNQIVPT